MNERKRKYTAKENRRRYRLHYEARRQGALVSARSKTCELPYESTPPSAVVALQEEFYYGVQFIIVE